MARNRKGRDISGWLIVDKPAGLTSTAVVNKVKWAMDAKKAGHAGTLDPAATGLLAVALGEATKTVPYITDATKCYTFEMVMGAATNTDDAEGEVIDTATLRPTDDEIKATLGQFVGHIEQVPPLFSAVKIDGVRAYKKARDGDDFEIKPRPLYVEELLMTDRRDADHVTLEMTCGKGGYVRAIARDLGRKLNCLGHVNWLRREWSGPFDLSHAIEFDTLDKHAKDPALDAHLLPLEVGLTDLPMVTCPAESVTRFRNGNNAMVFPGDVDYGDECWVSHDGQAIAVGVYKSGEVHPSRVFVAAS